MVFPITSFKTTVEEALALIKMNCIEGLHLQCKQIPHPHFIIWHDKFLQAHFKMPALWRLFDEFGPILKHGMKLAEIGEPCLQARSLANYTINYAFFIFNWSNTIVWGWNCWVWRNLMLIPTQESHLNNENCYFLCVLEGSTPLNKLSIGIHANIVLRDRNSTPHVTIFWKFFGQKMLKQRLNFYLSLLWWCRSR